jgi:hypothetical protein
MGFWSVKDKSRGIGFISRTLDWLETYRKRVMKRIFLEVAPDEQRTENTSKSKGLYFCKKLFLKTFGSCATIHINIFTEDRYTEKKLLKRAKNGDLGENVDFFKSSLLPPGSRQLHTAIGEQRQPSGWAKASLLKGTHARDFHRLFLNIFLHLSVTNRYKMQYSQTFSNIFFKFAQIFDIFDHSPFLPKARSTPERCGRKREVKFSVIFVTVRFRIASSILGENAESNFAFSAKARS